MNKKELEKRLDQLCSTVVRCREPRCFTCGKRLRFAERQAGHFVPRVVKWTRWDLDNVHTQCNRCNVELDGNLSRYREKLATQTKVTLDALYNAYKQGTLPEPSFEHKYQEYLFLLHYLRENFPAKAERFKDW